MTGGTFETKEDYILLKEIRVIVIKFFLIRAKS